MIINISSDSELSEIVNASYNKDSLSPFFRAFLRQFIFNNIALCRQYQVPVEHANKTNLNKSALIACLLPFFQHGELFRKMRASLPAPMPAIIDKILWEGGQDHESLEKNFAVKVAYTNQELDTSYPSVYAELNPLFCLFRDDYTSRSYFWSSSNVKQNRTSYRHFLYFPRPLADRLKKFVEPPFGYDLMPLPQPAPEAPVFDDPESLFSELPVALSYVQQGKLSVLESGAINVSSINKMRKYCGIKEFYPTSPDKYLVSIRTRFIAELILALKHSGITTYHDPVAFIKQGFELYQKSRLSSAATLFHLKGIHKVKTDKEVNPLLFSLLRELPLGQWVAAENLRKYVLYRDLPLKLVENNSAQNFLYFESDDNYGAERNYVFRSQYRSLLVEPLLRGTFYLFATFGLVDIAYTPPANPEAEKYKKPYISVFDSLQAVRLTPLGAYIGGLTKAYQAPIKPTENIVLDDQHLFISYTGDNKPLLTVLEKVARKAGEHLYKVDYESLLGDCHTQLEIEAKLNIFQQLLAADPPPIWQAFFAELQQKSFSLPAQNQDNLLFELPNNKELIRLMAGDDFLRKHILKAEMYYIIVPKANVNKVKNYLKKFGFLIDFGV